jgi:Domain of unknown function (DUF3797)
MNIVDSLTLMKQYGDCPQCGNDKLGDGEGTLNIENEIFTRTCKCGFEIKVDKRIKVITSHRKREKNKTITVYEVKIYGEKGTKYLPAEELKSLAGIRSVNQYAKVEEWLNTKEGRKWAIVTPHVSEF